MRRLRLPSLTYANVTASLALFIALGGTSYAVTQLPRNSVGTTQLRSSAVSTPKIKNGAVTADKLAGNARVRGPRGAQGPAGPAGAPGPQGPSNTYVTVRETGTSVSTTANVRTTVAEFPALPAGSYVFTSQVNTSDFNNGGSIVRCGIWVNGASVASTHIVLGNGAGSTRAATLNPTGTTSQPATFRATLECYSDQSLPAPPGVAGVRLVAVRVGSLD